MPVKKNHGESVGLALENYQSSIDDEMATYFSFLLSNDESAPSFLPIDNLVITKSRYRVFESD